MVGRAPAAQADRGGASAGRERREREHSEDGVSGIPAEVREPGPAAGCERAAQRRQREPAFEAVALAARPAGRSAARAAPLDRRYGLAAARHSAPPASAPARCCLRLRGGGAGRPATAAAGRLARLEAAHRSCRAPRAPTPSSRSMSARRTSIPAISAQRSASRSSAPGREAVHLGRESPELADRGSRAPQAAPGARAGAGRRSGAASAERQRRPGAGDGGAATRWRKPNGASRRCSRRPPAASGAAQALRNPYFSVKRTTLSWRHNQITCAATFSCWASHRSLAWPR